MHFLILCSIERELATIPWEKYANSADFIRNLVPACAHRKHAYLQASVGEVFVNICQRRSLG